MHKCQNLLFNILPNNGRLKFNGIIFLAEKNRQVQRTQAAATSDAKQRGGYSGRTENMQAGAGDNQSLKCCTSERQAEVNGRTEGRKYLHEVKTDGRRGKSVTTGPREGLVKISFLFANVYN